MTTFRYSDGPLVRLLHKCPLARHVTQSSIGREVVAGMDTPKPGWTPYVVYTTEILSFLHNIISDGKRSLKNQVSAGHLLPPDQRGPGDKIDNF